MRREKLAGGLAVLLIGLMFLLSNSGIMDLGVWSLALRYWPVLLVLAGLLVLVGLGFRWFVVVLLTMMIVLGTFGGPWLEYLPDGKLTTEVFTPEETADTLTAIVADLALDAPRVRVLPPVEGPYSITCSYRNAAAPRFSFAVGDDGRGLLTLEQRGSGSAAGFRQLVDLALSAETEVDLRLRVGAMTGDLDLSQYRLRRLSVDGGAIHLQAKLGNTPGAVTVDVDCGAGNFSFAVPREVGLRVTADFGVGIKQLSQAGLRKTGSFWEDELYGTAASNVEIRVDGGVGRVSITRY